jgi:hypothetical protein
VFEWNIALIRILFPLSAVSAASNFSVSNLASKQSTQRFFVCFFCVTLAPGFGSFMHVVTARWRLGAYGRCLWPLGAYVIEPPNRGSLIVVLNTRNKRKKPKRANQG